MTIPSFDLNELKQNKGLDRLREALHTIGFITIKNHQIPQELIEQYFDQSANSLQRDLNTKRNSRMFPKPMRAGFVLAKKS